MDQKRRRGPGRPFQPGNPGKPKGSRNKLSEDFFRALSDDFSEHGVKAIEDARAADPVAYVNVVAKLMPKELKVERRLGDLSDADLDRILAHVTDVLGAGGAEIGAGSGEGAKAGRAALN